MSTKSAFRHAVNPVLQLLLAGREEALLSMRPDQALQERIEILASKCTEDELTEDERAEYAGYVQANDFVAVLRREAQSRQAVSAAS